MSRGAYARGKWALGECARSGRKMLLRNMVADGYYPNLIVDPHWYEPKHPQESLPSLKDPVSLFRPAPDRDQVSGLLNLGGAENNDDVPGGGFGQPSGSEFVSSAVQTGYEIGNVAFEVATSGDYVWEMDSTSTPEPDTGKAPVDEDFTYAVSPPTTGEASLRADSTGSSMGFEAPRRMTNVAAPLVLGNGFSIEYAVQPLIIGARSITGGDSRLIPGMRAVVNTQTGMFAMGFDNWNNPGAATDLTPYFALVSDHRSYQDLDERVDLDGEARGTTVMVLNNIYHLCGTLSASGVARIYVNGVQEGTDSINMTDWISIGNENLLSGSRTLRNYLEVGGQFLDGAHRAVANCGSARIDNARIYLVELDSAEVATKAAEIAFT